MTSAPDYQLQPKDIAAWPHLIYLQNILGAGRPNVDDEGVDRLAQWIEIMTSHEHITNPQGQWHRSFITPVYSSDFNPQLLAWFDGVFAKLEKFPTNYGTAANMPFSEIYLGYMYQVFIKTNPCWECLDTDTWYTAFEKGADSVLDYRFNGDCETSGVGPWDRPQVPTSWKDAINNVFKAWGSKGVPSELQSLGFDLIKPKNWTNADQLKHAVKGLWTEQAQTLSNLKSSKSLNDDECIFLLYLLSSLGTGNSDEQSAVETIVSHPTNSQELPNDTFINSLVYLILMLWVDPRGKFQWTNPQIANTLKTLQGVLTGSDKGTVAINTALGNYQKILKADPSYPMTDPYNPGIGFNPRKADLIGALNAAWSQLGNL